jgi:hypothetical protein
MFLFILGCIVGGSGGFIIAGLMAASKKEVPQPEVKENKLYILKRDVQ